MAFIHSDKIFNRADLIPNQPDVALLREHKINDEEFRRLIEILDRLPTMAELGVFSSMWSEHCSYKSSKVHLKRFPTTGEQVVVGPGENAGVVRLSGQQCVAFKMESHNHPSYIEPYQGSATGVGGILRDVFCMGARPIANLNCLRFGARVHTRTPYLFEEVVKGIGDYGNCVGIPTVGGNISFDQTYDGNCLVNAMTVGLIAEDKIFKGFASGVGNLVVYVGSATGRDGIHGATMASDSFNTAEEGERSTVQVGDPFTEKLLLEATLEVLEKDLVVGLQDMGAAGLTSSSFEMAERAGNGLYIDLDKVPVRAEAMTAYELLLSESQERMLMVVQPENWQAMAKVFEKWQLSYAIIGEVTDSARVHATFRGKLEVDIPVGPITDKAPKYNRPMQAIPKKAPREDADWIEEDPANLLLKILADAGDKQPIYSQYDHHIGRKTVFGPESKGAAVLWINTPLCENNHIGLAIATACNERLCGIDPYQGGARAVLKCARAIAAAGGTPLAITDCLNFGNPEDPHVMWQFSQAVDGISEACQALNTPVVSGNVSLYNETDSVSILPTPMVGMVGKIDQVDVANPATIEEDCELLWIKLQEPHLAGSLVVKVASLEDADWKVSAVDWRLEKVVMEFLVNRASDVVAARDIAESGLLATLLKMIASFGGSKLSETISLFELFGADSGYLVGIRHEKTEQFINDCPAPCIRLGCVERTVSKVVVGCQSIELETIRSALCTSMRI